MPSWDEIVCTIPKNLHEKFKSKNCCEEVVRVSKSLLVCLCHSFEGHCHLEHVQDDAAHDDEVELAIRLSYHVEKSTDWILGYFNDFWLCIEYHLHHIYPLDLMSLKKQSFFFISLSSLKVHKEHSNEEIHKEEGTNEHECHKEVSVVERSCFFGTVLYSSDIGVLVHHIWPSFLSSHNKKSQHSTNDIIKVLAVCLPFSS